MALALNVFKTVTKVATTNAVGIYTAPVGYTAVVLLAQATNIGNNTQTVSFSHQRSTAGIAVTTEIVKSFPISWIDFSRLSRLSHACSIIFILLLSGGGRKVFAEGSVRSTLHSAATR